MFNTGVANSFDLAHMNYYFFWLKVRTYSLVMYSSNYFKVGIIYTDYRVRLKKKSSSFLSNNDQLQHK